MKPSTTWARAARSRPSACARAGTLQTSGSSSSRSTSSSLSRRVSMSKIPPQGVETPSHVPDANVNDIGFFHGEDPSARGAEQSSASTGRRGGRSYYRDGGSAYCEKRCTGGAPAPGRAERAAPESLHTVVRDGRRGAGSPRSSIRTNAGIKAHGSGRGLRKSMKPRSSRVPTRAKCHLARSEPCFTAAAALVTMGTCP